MDTHEGLRGVGGFLLWAFALAIGILLIVPHVFAGDPQFWGNYPPEVHKWFPTVMQPGYEDASGRQGHSCCGSTDAFEGRIVGEDSFGNISVIIDDGKTIVPDGTVVQAPREKIQTHYGNPVGKLIVFISVGDHRTVFCLVPIPMY
jgi:hypothetical protein